MGTLDPGIVYVCVVSWKRTRVEQGAYVLVRSWRCVVAGGFLRPHSHLRNVGVYFGGLKQTVALAGQYVRHVRSKPAYPTLMRWLVCVWIDVRMLAGVNLMMCSAVGIPISAMKRVPGNMSTCNLR